MFNSALDSGWQSANGKIILFGEHAVVYGAKAIAAGIPDAVKARVTDSQTGATLSIPSWSIQRDLVGEKDDLLSEMFWLICSELGLLKQTFSLVIDPKVPAASGLGASAALAVSSIRALSVGFGLALSNHEINMLAFQCETLAHGNPSGLDNTLATYGGLLDFQRVDGAIRFQPILGVQPIELVVALSGKKGYTAETVARIRALRETDEALVDSLFQEIELARANGRQALINRDLSKLSKSFVRNQGCLAKLGVSCKEIEDLIRVAQNHGALGAKLTGSGDGGAVIVLTESNPQGMQGYLHRSGFESLLVTVQSSDE